MNVEGISHLKLSSVEQCFSLTFKTKREYSKRLKKEKLIYLKESFKNVPSDSGVLIVLFPAFYSSKCVKRISNL